MSATHNSRQRREPLSQQTIFARVFVAVISIALFVVVFILPWVMD